MADYLERIGGSPGRSAHRLAIAAARVVYEAREAIADLFNAPDPLRVVFTLNVTHAINLALQGLLRPGDRVVTTGVEHNAVMRPLRALAERGVEVVIVPCRPDGTLDLRAFAAALPRATRLVIINHASNVVGTLLPVAECARLAHKAGALLLVDAAQTGGAMPLDMQASGIDLLAFTGHKGLLGPTGTGGLILGEAVDLRALEPLVRGGTGSYSEADVQPEHLPDKYESGTLNAVGIAGLGAGVRYVLKRGVENIRAHEVTLTGALREGLSAIPGITLYGPPEAVRSVAVVSFTAAGWRVSDLGLRLDEEFGILCRVGLHCCPAAHRTIGTYPAGTVRFAPGPFTTIQEIDVAVAAVARLVRK